MKFLSAQDKQGLTVSKHCFLKNLMGHDSKEEKFNESSLTFRQFCWVTAHFWIFEKCGPNLSYVFIYDHSLRRNQKVNSRLFSVISRSTCYVVFILTGRKQCELPGGYRFAVKSLIFMHSFYKNVYRLLIFFSKGAGFGKISHFFN